MKGLTTFWSSFPPAHKKRFYLAVGGYALIVALTGTWVSVKATDTVKTWQSRSPSAKIDIRKPSAASVGNTFDKQATIPIGGPVIAVIVTGLGLSANISDRAILELPSEITLAFSPYASELNPWLQKSFHAHHESLIMLPMESEKQPENDPGPRAISSRVSDDENQNNLKWILTQAKGTAGVINMMGSRILNDKRRLQPVFETLQQKRTIFVETTPSEKSMGRAVAEKVSLPYMAADLQIDVETTEKDIRQQLERLEKLAQERGYAVAVAEPYPLTISMLKTWAPTLEKRGITLAPLSAVWKNKPNDQKNTAPTDEQIPSPLR